MGLCFTVLGSGSSGNATLVSDGETHILVDVGLSGRETARRLREIGLEPERVSAIVISHEHGDHCRGVGPFAKGLDIPVFMTEEAFGGSGLRLDERRLRSIRPGEGFQIGGIGVTGFSVPHDATDPLGFVLEKDGVRISIALDLGFLSNLVLERLRGSDAIVLESNHDERLLKVGPYPWALKQRVMSRRGHLSNDSVAHYLAHDFDGRAAVVVLAHLSKQNNLPELALLSARRALEERAGPQAPQTRIELAHPDRIGPTFRY
ncbi:MAG: MBL fold metallo-hydrolase [Acidobacteria bacterium]|jgi:phosphoribosyl 1,2-cyclic phosphodiesterase|nr:MBL fold metallo-hydrolase [Acidobacteriota bacterium]